jgi:hypothetical protein
VDHPTVLLLGTLTNRRGHVVAATYLAVEFPNLENLAFCLTTAYGSVAELARGVGFDADLHNPGPVATPEQLQPMLGQAVRAATAELRVLFTEADREARQRVAAWQQRASTWLTEADALVQRSGVRRRRKSVQEKDDLTADMTPDRQLVRPLLLVVPDDHPTAAHRRPGEDS